MTTRTFIQRGKAYGQVPCTIIAKIDNTIVYEGPVTTVDEPFPTQAWIEANTNLFSWTNTVDFQGTQTLEIAVTGSVLTLSTLVANYNSLQNPGASDYNAFFYETIGGVKFCHPCANVKIDGVDWPIQIDDTATGQPSCRLRPGQVYTATVRINPGYDINPT